jgi:hypothetical protein
MEGKIWEASWIDGERPTDIAPLIFKISKRKKAPFKRLWRRIFGSPK